MPKIRERNEEAAIFVKNNLEGFDRSCRARTVQTTRSARIASTFCAWYPCTGLSIYLHDRHTKIDHAPVEQTLNLSTRHFLGHVQKKFAVAFFGLA